MSPLDHDDVKERLLIEGLMDFVALREVHSRFAGRDPAQSPPLKEVQKCTLDIIEELVNEGLFVPGYPNKKDPTGFTQLSLAAAMADIRKSYIDNFDDHRGWSNFVWMKLTDEGKKLALNLYHADDP